jgi:hypothetical protein
MVYMAYYFETPAGPGADELLAAALSRIEEMYAAAGIHTLSDPPVGERLRGHFSDLVGSAREHAERGQRLDARFALRTNDPFGRQAVFIGRPSWYEVEWLQNNPGCPIAKIRLEDLLSYNDN